VTINTVNFNHPLLEIYRRTTTGSGVTFSIPSEAEALNLMPAHETGDMTTLTIDVEVANDAVTIWKKVSVGLALAANGSLVDCRGWGGRLVRLTSTVFTLGSVTTAVINASAFRQP
jgi:hypothetical protein